MDLGEMLAKLTTLQLDRFQEWPQLLDPTLAGHVQMLSEAFIAYLTSGAAAYDQTPGHGDSNGVVPLPRALSRLLYTLCKVRGYKIIVRLLNNEPRYLAPMLTAFRQWNEPSAHMTWEERYIMLLWLSHLMLAPFELSNISIGDWKAQAGVTGMELGKLPAIAGGIAEIAFEQLSKPSKEQEAASILLVRLVLRKDMQARGLLVRLAQHVTRKLMTDEELTGVDAYQALGHLSLIHRLVSSGSDSEVAPFLSEVFSAASVILSSEEPRFLALRDPAPARKLLLKIMRHCMTHAISLSDGGHYPAEDRLDAILEDGIQYFLDALGDKDTPVRMTAAKALSIVALRLETEMSAEIVEAVLGGLQENVLLDDTASGKLVPFTDRPRDQGTTMKRNISAVDSMKWHGLMLTLGHLLFRRSPPPYMLSEIIHALMLGLEFEQRSNVGTSVGVGVRDAACFGIWSLARKYSTLELKDVDISAFAYAHASRFEQVSSVLQFMACRLVISACLDPSGNIRRGSSAALQELIGRHPDTIFHGIPVVQIVDYHAVARLSRAMTEVSAEAAKLDTVYHRSILYALVEWRGSRAVDVSGRRWAADAIRILSKDCSVSELQSFIKLLFSQLLDLKPLNVGSTAGARHGLLLAIGACIETLLEKDNDATHYGFDQLARRSLKLKQMTGTLDNRRITADIELVMEAISALISKSSRLLTGDWISEALETLDYCTLNSSKDFVVQASSMADLEMFKCLPESQARNQLTTWLDQKVQKPANFVSKGRIQALSLISTHIAAQKSFQDLQTAIILYLTAVVQGPYRIETRVDAMDGLSIVLSSLPNDPPGDVTHITKALTRGLTDYTNDQRGDIGSLLRLASIDAIGSFFRNCERMANLDGKSSACSVLSASIANETHPLVARLAAEKLNSVRYRAWQHLAAHGRAAMRQDGLDRFNHLSDVSSKEYYAQIMPYLSLPDTRDAFLLGLVSSATAGSEDICRAACNALLDYILTLAVAERGALVGELSRTLLRYLAKHGGAEDRVVISSLDFIAFLLDQNLFSISLLAPADNESTIWDILAKVHAPNSSMPRIEACVGVYSRLLAVPATRERALDKLSRMLLHRWPKIRNAASEALYLDQEMQALAETNWSAAIERIKPVVLKIRREKGVSGKAA